jgi:low molecular weight protein-tyrosine phosphatase
MTVRRVLMVCMGNICRSPTAEAVLREKLRTAGLADRIEVDSAGTHDWHAGAPPDPRSVAHARRRGYDLSALRSRPVRSSDFEQFDLILAMDWDNLEHLASLCPAPHRAKLGRLTEHCQRLASPVVPDPYAGPANGFERVVDLVEDACDGLVASLLEAHRAG